MNVIGILMHIALNMEIAFGSIQACLLKWSCLANFFAQAGLEP
jgi:hypothetical protein